MTEETPEDVDKTPSSTTEPKEPSPQAEEIPTKLSPTNITLFRATLLSANKGELAIALNEVLKIHPTTFPMLMDKLRTAVQRVDYHQTGSPALNQTCSGCKRSYDAFLNEGKDVEKKWGGNLACEWHDGELQLDGDSPVWKEVHKEDSGNSMMEDQEWLARVRKDGYKWSCCGGEGEHAKKCQHGKHDGSRIRG